MVTVDFAGVCLSSLGWGETAEVACAVKIYVCSPFVAP